LTSAEEAFYSDLQRKMQAHLDAIAEALTEGAPEIREHLAAARGLQAQLRDLLERVARKVDRYEQILDLLDDEDDTGARVAGGLRGRAIGDAAIRVLRLAGKSGEWIHYREWFRLFEQAGYRVDGASPQAGFLTAINRHPLVEGVGDRSGLYRVKS
jgi:hypothetical protein